MRWNATVNGVNHNNEVIRYTDIMTVHTHPVLEGPFVFLSVPTPSFWDQLKLKNKV